MSIIQTPLREEWPIIKVYGMDFRYCLKDMADTITRLELWDWFKNESPPVDKGYSWWDHPNINKISDGLTDNSHSGATFGYCMRCMQSIANNGFNDWCNQQLNNVPN